MSEVSLIRSDQKFRTHSLASLDGVQGLMGGPVVAQVGHGHEHNPEGRKPSNKCSGQVFRQPLLISLVQPTKPAVNSVMDAWPCLTVCECA